MWLFVLSLNDTALMISVFPLFQPDITTEEVGTTYTTTFTTWGDGKTRRIFYLMQNYK